MDDARFAVPVANKTSRCLSCGQGVKDGRRRYCSQVCRQGLETKLNLAVGLLKALDTRFATFSFTDSVLYLHVLPFGPEEVYSYVYGRSPLRKPSQDFWDMVEGLGRLWHGKQRQTGKRHVASKHVLAQADRNEVPPDLLKPREIKSPAVRKRSIKYFRLSSSDLTSPQAKSAIRSAYRREAKIHHPDHGGEAEMFRSIHAAHQELMDWVKNPRFTVRGGVPGRWSFSSERGRKWLPPATPARRSE